MRCNATIYLDKKERCVTHCQLDAGHVGDHAIVARAIDIRCAAEKDGRRCSQPHGHFGNHHVVNGAVIESSWS